MTNEELAFALLERHGAWLAKSGHWNGFSAILYALSLLRGSRQTNRSTAAEADDLYRANGQLPYTSWPITPAGGGVKHRQSRSGSAPCQSPDRLAHVTGLKQ